ncbi:MAG TPA: hypothetical protein VNB06_09720, partial [Thermoanaerobaculia bacterium]|nr:hypothetical protein [Thermoanaerobaculia bacterium]
WLVAPWEEEDLNAAVECARWVVRRIRAQVFWPPGPPPRWDDGVAGIVGDRYPSRYRAVPARTPAVLAGSRAGPARSSAGAAGPGGGEP